MTYTYKISVTKVIVESEIKNEKKKTMLFFVFLLHFMERKMKKNKGKLIKENINNRWKSFLKIAFIKAFMLHDVLRIKKITIK